MASERAGVREGLAKTLEWSPPRESMFQTYLATSLTHVRLLAGVHTRVHGQGGSLYELLSAAGVVAHVRSYSTMNTLCQNCKHAIVRRSSEKFRAYHDAPSRFSSQNLSYR